VKRIHILLILILTSPLFLLNDYSGGEVKADNIGNNKAIIIALDVSSSMEGEPLRKVRDVLGKSVARLPDAAVVGLVTYSGCGRRHVRVRVPLTVKGQPNYGSKEAVARSADRAYARGFTDIYTALRKVETEIKRLPPGWCTKVILLSDGADSCGVGDYRRVAKRISTDYGNCNNIDIISIGVPFWDRDVFDNIADDARGTHRSIDAANEDDLFNAIEDLIIGHKTPRTDWASEDPKDPSDDEGQTDDDEGGSDPGNGDDPDDEPEGATLPFPIPGITVAPTPKP
jgi:uncharacterized protein YegL